MDTCKKNFADNIFSIMLQVAFIYSFIVFFFFSYVQYIEKKEFHNQLNIIVDSILKDFDEDLKKISKNNIFYKQHLILFLNSTIDVLEEKINMESKIILPAIIKKNNELKNKAYKSLIIIGLIVVTVFLIIRMSGINICLSYHIKNALLLVVFIGITEYVFLTIIGRRYISIQPNEVKKNFGKNILDWIKYNKKDV